jgi:hypothetical protein
VTRDSRPAGRQIVSVPFTYKLFSNLGDEDSVLGNPGTYGGAGGYGRPPGSFVLGAGASYQPTAAASSYQAEAGGYQNAKDEL